MISVPQGIGASISPMNENNSKNSREGDLLELYWKYKNLKQQSEAALEHVQALMRMENMHIPVKNAAQVHTTPDEKEDSSLSPTREQWSWLQMLNLAERILEEHACYARKKGMPHRMPIYVLVERVEKYTDIPMDKLYEPTVASRLSTKLSTARKGGKPRFHSIRGEGWTLYAYKDTITNKEQTALTGGNVSDTADSGTAPDASSDE